MNTNSLWLVWRDWNNKDKYLIGELTYDNNIYKFKYLDSVKDAIEVGFDYYPSFDDLDKVYESKELFLNIKVRLPNPKRPDYLEILNNFDLKCNSTEMEILEKTGGRLLTDSFEFVPSFNKNGVVEFEVINTNSFIDANLENLLKINRDLEFEIEDKDKYSLKVKYLKKKKKYQIGYVPRFYSKEIINLLNKNTPYSLKIARIIFNNMIGVEHTIIKVKLIFDTKAK